MSRKAPARQMRRRVREEIYRWVFASLAFASLAALIGITAVLFKEGIPFFREVSLKEFFLGTGWYPTHEEAPEFGALPLILASVWVTAGAVLVSVPLGVGTALFLSELCPPRLRSFLKPTVEILAGIPSVIFGFFAIAFIAPVFQKLFNLPTGLCALTASLTLGIMATPTVCSIAEDAVSFVPGNLREAALALGANKWQTLVRVVIPAAGSGIITGIILGTSRAIGETMVVLMAAGGAAVIPRSFTVPVRPITSTIAAEMGETVVGSTHFHALFALGLILFLITFLFNILAEVVSRRFRMQLGGDL